MAGGRMLNYTTKVSARQTAQECADLLADAGADHVSVSYSDREPTGLGFRLDTPAGRREFAMPVNVEAMHKALLRMRDRGEFPPAAAVNRLTSPEQAARVAWRIVKDWVEVEVARVQVGMASASEAFAAYWVVEAGPYAGRLLYQALAESEARALPAGGEAPGAG